MVLKPYHYMYVQMFPELEQNDQASNDSVFVTEEVVMRLSEGLAVWECQNSEPLGQLWLGLFKYGFFCYLLFNCSALCHGQIWVIKREMEGSVLRDIQLRYSSPDK